MKTAQPVYCSQNWVVAWLWNQLESDRAIDIEIQSQEDEGNLLMEKQHVGQVIPLEFLSVGERGRIYNLDGDRGLVDRLAEMGIRQGVEIHMVSPGSPCIVAFDNHRFSFRCDEAASVLVEVIDR